MSKEALNIWFIHHYALPPYVPGVTRHFRLAKELQKQGHNVIIIAAHQHHKNTLVSLGKDEKNALEDIDNVRFLWIKGFSISSGLVMRILSMFVFAFKILCKTGFSKIAQKPDLIIGCTPDPFTAFAAHRVSKAYNVPYVLHVGDLWPLSLIDLGKKPKWHPFIVLIGWLEKYLYWRAEKIITPLPSPHAYIDKIAKQAGKVECIPIGIDHSMCPDTPPVPDRKDVFKVYYAGSHGRANGLRAILASAFLLKAHQDIEFHLIGDGEYKAELMALCQKKGLTNVTFHDPVKQSDLYQRLFDADAFIINYEDCETYRIGGISANKIFDYMLCGRPIILGAPTEQDPVTAAGAGIKVYSNDKAAIKEAILKLYNTPVSERQAMADKARAYVVKHHDYGVVGERLNSALSKL